MPLSWPRTAAVWARTSSPSNSVPIAETYALAQSAAIVPFDFAMLASALA
jgi:hypothetical protein